MGRIYRLVLAVAFLGFLVPVLRVPIPEGVAPVIRWVGLGLAVVCGLALSGEPQAPARGGWTLVAGAAFLSSAALSSIGGVNPALAFAKLAPLAAEILLAVAVLPAVMALDDWSWLLARVRWLLTAVCGLALGIGLAIPGGVNADGRLAAVSNPNSTGFLAMCSCCLWLWVSGSHVSGRHSWKRGLGMLSVCGATLWWTGSRASIGGFLVGFALWALVRRRWRLAGASAMLVALIYLVAPHLIQTGTEAAEVKLLRGGSLTGSRELIWEESLSSWGSQPWLGYGFGVSATADAWEAGQLGQSVGALRDGSGYLGLLESVGIMGAAFLAVMLSGVLCAAWSGARSGDQSPASSLCEVGLLIIGSLLANAIGEPWLLGPGSFQSFVLWTTVGMVMGAQAAIRRTPPFPRWAHSARRRHPAAST
jgi:O-antigen ligase